ncbi:MAG: amidohydrolase family protein, partial [Chloroflexi bacterium]|nr:amidohydrolase family protein [Chloroflexota bacterium]
MATQQHVDPSRRRFLQTAAVGLAFAPMLGAYAVANAEPGPEQVAASAAGGLSIIDAHIHLWDLSVFPVPWIVGDAVLDRSYLLQDYEDQSAGLGVDGIVFVQAAVANEYSLLEADWVRSQAARDPLIKGMVAYAPLEYGDQVRSYLDALMTRGSLIKGIRRGLPDPTDTKFDMDGFIRGIQILPEYGLSFDILGKGTPHLNMAIQIAQQAPDTSLIIDHLLKPFIKERQLEPWRSHMTTLAGFPNVWTKISGLATEADLQNWTPEDLQPYVDHALSVFGEDRVVFGGDWPPVLTAHA